MAPKVLLIAGDASEDLEVYYPYQRMLEEGYEVDIAAPSVKTLQLVIHDFVPTFDTFTEKPGHTIKSSMYVTTQQTWLPELLTKHCSAAHSRT